jgi:N-acetyl-anhydromuramyl-L-alanine amidase AmpD
MFPIDTYNDNLYNNIPVRNFPLPANKLLNQTINHLQIVVLSISRSAINIGMELARLDSDNNHARHLVIDRDGTIYQFAPLNQQIKHLLVQRNGFHNHNSIAIELINVGKIFAPENHTAKIILSSGDFRQSGDNYKQTIACKMLRGHHNLTYEAYSFTQIHALEKIFQQLNLKSPMMAINICKWDQTHSLTPVFPFSKLKVIK